MNVLTRLGESLNGFLRKVSPSPNLIRSLAFGMKYLKPYRTRFITGVLLGVLFGSLNGLFISATSLVVTRLDNSPSSQKPFALEVSTIAIPAATEAPAGTPANWRDSLHASYRSVQQWGKAVKTRVGSFFVNHVDRWLPKQGRSPDWKQIAGVVLLLAFLTGLRGGTGYASSYCMAWTSQRVVMDLKADVFRKLNSLSLDYFNQSTTSVLLTRINGDTAALNSCLRLGLSDLVKEPITVVGIFAALLYKDWQLTLLAMIFIPLMVIPISVISRKVRKAARSNYDMEIDQSNLLIDSLVNIRIVQAFGLQKQQTDDFLTRNRRVMSLGLRMLKAKEIMNPIIELFASIGLSLVIIYVFCTGRTVADFVPFALGIAMFYTPFKKLAGIHVYFLQTEVPLLRLMELFAMQPTVKDPPRPAPLPPFHSGLRLRNVSFRYTPEREILHAVSIEVPRGKKIGLAGESGSGKSTLINLLFRFYDPTEGVIEIDGVDLRQVSLNDLRAQMALVSQDVLLFNASVAENIGYGKIGATREEIIEAARNASAHEFILRMPQGYDTPIGERGVLISGGQRQRLAIARAFVRNAPILVLDEATASLDSQSESEVQAAIDRLADGRTVVCIAHRLSTLSSMNKIYVFREGQIIEEGGFEELLQRGGAFAAMAKRQSIVAAAQPA